MPFSTTAAGRAECCSYVTHTHTHTSPKNKSAEIKKRNHLNLMLGQRIFKFLICVLDHVRFGFGHCLLAPPSGLVVRINFALQCSPLLLSPALR